MTLGEAINSLVDNWKELARLANGPTARYGSERIASQKPGTRAPTDFGSEAEQLKAMVVQLAQIWKLRTVVVIGGGEVENRRHSDVYSQAVRQCIRDSVGISSKELAEIYGWSVRTIERIRRNAGQNAGDGTPEERPLTQTRRLSEEDE